MQTSTSNVFRIKGSTSKIGLFGLNWLYLLRLVYLHKGSQDEFILSCVIFECYKNVRAIVDKSTYGNKDNKTSLLSVLLVFDDIEDQETIYLNL